MLPRPICRACRQRQRVLVCDYCQKPFRPTSGTLTQRYCSIQHGALGRWLNWRDRVA